MDRRAERHVRFTFEVSVPPSKAETFIWVPQPLEDEWQRLLGSQYPDGLAREEGTDRDSRNRSVRLTAPPHDAPLRFEVSFDLARKLKTSAPASPEPADTIEPSLDRWLKPNKKVPLDGVVGEESKKLGSWGEPPATLARRAFDQLLQTLDYDAAGCTPERFDQLGNLEVACDLKKGTCTEFHGLLVGYLRALGVPARFVFGFNLPRDKSSGPIRGYHCWSEVLMPGRQWFSVDVSEAWKARSRGEPHDFYFGSIDADRVAFTRDRDVNLAPRQASAPLDKFIFPYAESNGAEARLDLSFRFEDLNAT